jgi:hypothetical protein
VELWVVEACVVLVVRGELEVEVDGVGTVTAGDDVGGTMGVEETGERLVLGARDTVSLVALDEVLIRGGGGLIRAGAGVVEVARGLTV